MGLLESIRRWIDGTDPEDALSTVDENSHPRRVWEEFLVRIAREVEAVMQNEMFTPPGGQTFIPREYIVYLSPDDDKEWRGEKRRGLEQGLFHVLSERARELAGQTNLATKSFAVELRVDGTLNKGEFRVQPVWDETETSHTQVIAPRATASAPTGAQQAAQSLATLPMSALNHNALNAAHAVDDASSEGEVTQVRALPQALFSLEVWRNGVRQAVVPVMKNEITIGRGSQTVPVDIAIKGDPEVSRIHATLDRDNGGNFFLTSKGRNPTTVTGRELAREERTPVEPDAKIGICSYTLRIQPN